MIISRVIDKANPVSLKMIERSFLSQKPAEHETYHIVLNTENSGLEFKVGDSLGIYAQNDPILVAHLMEALSATPEERVLCPRSQQEMTLLDFFSFKANLSRVTSSFLKLFYHYEQKKEKKAKLLNLLQKENHQEMVAYLKHFDPLGLFKEFRGTQIPLQEICAQFGPLLPRFYSIASSPLLFPKEVHLTVALSSFTHSEEIRYGVASHFLCHLAIPHETAIPVYVQPAPHFQLPDDDLAPLIMVGPGTGIAPFRAFLQERKGRSAAGKNWLFFGERYRRSSYFYEDELEHWVREGFLKLNLAFSRDQEEKDYVWHAMRRNSQELWKWISNGAYFFVCGDAHSMAKDVERTLVEIIAQEGKCSQTAAFDYVKEMRKTHRYLADVY